MAQKLEFDYDGEHYILEFSKNVIRSMEASGFNINEIDVKPMTRIPQLWAGAFMMHHRKIRQEKVNEIYSHMSRKEDLIRELVNMYYEPMAAFIEEDEEEDAKKIEW